MPSTMKHSFAHIQRPQVPRSRFIRPTGTLTAFDIGQLVPILVDEILPGDTIEIDANYLCRLQTLIQPVFANMYLDVHFFFAPCRLLWENWEKFMGASDDAGAQTTEFLIPKINVDPINNNTGTLWDFFGLPTNTGILQIDAPSALPFRMYTRVWNEWYRDQNLQDNYALDLGDGPDSVTDITVKKRNKRKDYFTSALPWPQKGDSVAIPLGTQAPVFGDGQAIGFYNGSTSLYASHYPGTSNGDVRLGTTSGANGGTPGGFTDATTKLFGLHTGLVSGVNRNHMFADLSDASAITVNALRDAIAMQHMLERDARGGTRYTEILLNAFGVQVPDYRLQRTELIGMMSQRIDIRAVSQTSQTDTTPQANQAAYSVTVARNQVKHSFVEHGYIMAIASVRHDIQYQQGMRKMWSRQTREDFYDPIFAHLGEQAIKRKEIYFANDGLNDQVWGYQERWSEYRYFPSMINSQFRNVVTAPSVSMKSWHLADYYSSAPSLNSAFIEESADVARIVAVTDEPQFLLDAYYMIDHYRPIPTFSNPGLDRI